MTTAWTCFPKLFILVVEKVNQCWKKASKILILRLAKQDICLQYFSDIYLYKKDVKIQQLAFFQLHNYNIVLFQYKTY